MSKKSKLKHPDWTDEKCVRCGVTLTKQELKARACFICHVQLLRSGEDVFNVKGN